MKEMISENGRKAILVLVEELLVVLAVLCLTTTAISVTRIDNNFSVMHRTPVFEQSDLFRNMVADRIVEIVQSSGLKSNFERDGEFYGRKIVDLAEYVEDGKMSGQQTRSVGYKLSDLIHWSRKGLKYKYIEDRDAITADAEMPETYEEGELSGGEGVSIKLDEEYAPAHGRSLFDYSNDKYSDEDLLRLLEQSLSKVKEDYQDYKELGVELRNDNTNVRFFLSDYANTNIYSNIDSGSFQEDDTIKTYGQYLILDSKNLEYESNMHVSDAYLFNMMTDLKDHFDGNYYLEFAIDTDYPVVDSISAARDEYYRYRPVIQAATMGAIVFIIGAFLCLVALTLSARNTIVGFDKIWAEIAGFVYIFVGMKGLLFVAEKTYELRMVRIEALCMAGGGAAVLNLLFITGYFSLVRRIKAGTLYRDSLTNNILQKCEYISAGITGLPSGPFIIIRTLLTFGAVLAMNFFLFFMGMDNYDNRYYIILAAVDTIIFIVMLHKVFQRRRILKAVQGSGEGSAPEEIDLSGLNGDNRELGRAINSMREGLTSAIKSSIKTEKLKADLITNVSHDIKTPLTSIINYVDLLKRRDIQDEKAREYIDVLDQKSMRLKTLTEDLVEASKITSGNISIEPVKLDMGMMISQMEGEVAEKFGEAHLTLVTNIPEEPVYIYADGRRLFRVLDNIYGNVAKYAMPDTRVYADLKADDKKAEFTLKNISKQALNIDASELTERFIRGDVSRSTEGSGLGLSIAESLTELQNGEFKVNLDGDLFKVTLGFERME
ncbi:MAG: HAMP domain-containing histidine kinase [Lachnospiraceae bacterium]|nr:HAMP domain-containing histidine kinase [Lachnospiraceae bacterium]